MKSAGMVKERRHRRGAVERSDIESTREGLERREVRSYEAEYVHGLWHSDFHHGSLKVLTPQGEWVVPRLLATLDDRSRLSCHSQWYLSETAEATQAWVEMEYHRTLHSETGQTPLCRFLEGPSVARECPCVDELRLAFCTETSRRQRRSDGTFTLSGIRFEIPGRFRHDIHLSPNGDGSTTLEWRQVITALDESGDRHVAALKEEDFTAMIESLETMLDHYLETGELLEAASPQKST